MAKAGLEMLIGKTILGVTISMPSQLIFYTNDGVLRVCGNDGASNCVQYLQSVDGEMPHLSGMDSGPVLSVDESHEVVDSVFGKQMLTTNEVSTALGSVRFTWKSTLDDLLPKFKLLDI